MSSKILQLTVVSHDLPQTEKYNHFYKLLLFTNFTENGPGWKKLLFCDLVNQVIKHSTEES